MQRDRAARHSVLVQEIEKTATDDLELPQRHDAHDSIHNSNQPTPRSPIPLDRDADF